MPELFTFCVIALLFIVPTIVVELLAEHSEHRAQAPDTGPARRAPRSGHRPPRSGHYAPRAHGRRADSIRTPRPTADVAAVR